MKTLKLKEISELKTGPFGTQFSAKEYVSEGIPVINVKNIGYGKIISEGLDYVVNNPVPVSLLSGDRKLQIRFLGNHHSGSGNLYHKSFRM